MGSFSQLGMYNSELCTCVVISVPPRSLPGCYCGHHHLFASPPVHVIGMMRRSSALCLWSLVKNKHEDILERIEASPCKSTCQILSAVNGSETMYSKGDTLGQITGMNLFNLLLDRSIFERFPASTFTFTPNSCGLPC